MVGLRMAASNLIRLTFATCASGFKVIGAGFPKTGTNSLASALDILGFRTYHAGTWHMFHAENWTRVIRSDTPQPLFDMAKELVSSGFNAAVDTPIPAYTLELLHHFPSAKVILMRRDMDAWFKSFLEQSKTNSQLYRWGLVGEANMLLMEITNREMYNCSDHPPTLDDRARAISAHLQHLERIRQNIPADQLLEFNVSDGWEPLCSFLGVQVPNRSFA